MTSRTSIVLYFTSLVLFLLIPLKIETGQYYVVHLGLEVKTSKNSPAYLAFEMSEKAFQAKTKIVSLDYQNIDLSVHSDNQSEIFQRMLRKPLHLASLVIQRPAEDTKPNRFVAAVQPGVPVVKGPKNMSVKATEIRGPIEFSGGLALTPEHHIEVRRLEDGIPVESGTVNISDGTFNVSYPQKKGIIVARLIDKDGAELGEGRINLEKVEDNSANKLVINPPATFSYQTVTLNDSPIPHSQGRATSRNQETTKTVITQDQLDPSEPNGMLVAESIDRSSSAIGESRRASHADSIYIAIPGDTRPVTQLSQTTVAALRSIVSDQRSFNLNDPDGTLIWGRVEADGKPLEGVKVTLEDDETIMPVYFNEAFLPQADLTATSSNGYFAFVNVSEGFKTVRAFRNFGTISYDNVIVEGGKVSIARLTSTIQTHNVPIYVFDAFSGERQATEIELQAFDQPLKIENGVGGALLNSIPRQSYLFCHGNDEYLAGQYLYNDNTDAIQVPLLKAEWLNTWVTDSKVQIDRTQSTIAGFVPDEDFEIFLTGNHEETSEALVYFDATGKTVPAGVRGGGFAIFNLNPGIQEVIVQGKTSKKQYIRLVPADAGSLTVLTFN